RHQRDWESVGPSPPSPRPLDGRAIVVTGAGRGVGRGIAQACAAAGAHVVVASPSANGQETVDVIDEAGGSAGVVKCDVTNGADVEGAVAAALTHSGRLDAM